MFAQSPLPYLPQLLSITSHVLFLHLVLGDLICLHNSNCQLSAVCVLRTSGGCVNGCGKQGSDCRVILVLKCTRKPKDDLGTLAAL